MSWNHSSHLKTAMAWVLGGNATAYGKIWKENHRNVNISKLTFSGLQCFALLKSSVEGIASYSVRGTAELLPYYKHVSV